MKIAAIIPTLDEAARIGPTIDAIRDAGITDIVIADGGSTDCTRSIAQERGARVITSPRGRANQQNAGAAATRADALVFVHSDSLLPRDAATWIRATLADRRVTLGAFRTRTRFDATDRSRTGARAPLLSRLLWLADVRGRFGRTPYGDQALFLRSETFVAAGGFPAVPLFEDVALARKLQRRGTVRVVPSAVTVSGRRFIAHPISATVYCHLFPLLFDLGVSPAHLARRWSVVR